MSKLKELSPYLLILSISIFYLLLEIKRFYLGYYGFHDLGLISDFLANTVYGKYFYITDYGINHLSVNFSPTIFFIIFFYRIFDSQIITLLLTVISSCISAFPLMILSRKYFSFKKIPPHINLLFTLIILFLYFNNIYFYFILSSGSFVTIFTLLSFIYFIIIFEHPNTMLAWILLICLLGLRQDSAIYNICNITAVIFFKGYRAWSKKELLILISQIILCVIYAVIITVYVLPIFGNDALEYPIRFYPKYGENWFQVFINFILKPGEVINDYINSGFFKWNQSFGYFQIFSPILLLIESVSGILFFTANSFDRNHLLLYNSAFIFPGIFISLIGSFYNIYFISRRSFFSKLLIISTIFIFCSFYFSSFKEYWRNQNIYNKLPLSRIFDLKSSEEYVTIREFIENNNIESFSADFNSFVFIPNSKIKYLLRNRNKSDAVIIKKNFSHIFAGDLNQTNFEDKLLNEGWIKIKEENGIFIFVKK